MRMQENVVQAFAGPKLLSSESRHPLARMAALTSDVLFSVRGRGWAVKFHRIIFLTTTSL